MDQVDKMIVKGNPDFNLNSVEPSNTIAAAAITPEDLALDRELERMATENPPPTVEQGPPPTKKEVDRRELLSGSYDCDPASTINEILEQVHLAKEYGCDSIEATPSLVRHYCRKDFPEVEKVGYFMFHDIKVYIAGLFDQAKERDKLTIEQKLFGNSK